MRRLDDPQTLVIDVRPREEYAAGHIPGALSVPLGEFVAHQAIEMLRRAGVRARRLVEGLPEWRLAGFPVEVAG
jgi:rhodanese-related sulfurtransferase